MLRIGEAYGRKAFDAWERSARTSLDLSNEKSTPDDAASTPWPVKTFAQLVKDIAFLTVMMRTRQDK